MDILFYVIRTGLLLYLAAAAFMDIRTGSFPLEFLCIGFTAGFVLQTVNGRLALWEMLLGVLTGGALALIAGFSREAIGYGDCFMLAACGAWLGFYENIALIIITLALTAVFGGCMMILKKKKGKDALPFAPFMLGGYVLLMVI